MMNREDENEYIKKLEKMDEFVLDDFGKGRRWKKMDLDQEIKLLERYIKHRCQTEDCWKLMRFVQGIEYKNGEKNLYQCPKCKSMRWV